MRNWKYINGAEVGNSFLKVWEDNKAIIRKDTDAGIYEIKFKQTGKTQIAKSLEEAQKIYKAESSEVGNKRNYEYKGFLISPTDDGITKALGPTGSEAKAKDWCDWHDPKTNKPVAEFRNSKTGNSTWYEPRRMPFQPRALRYAYEQAKKKGLSGQKLEAEMLRIVKTSPHDSAATESEMRKDVSEWVLHNGTPEDFVNNKGTETGNETMHEWATSKPRNIGNATIKYYGETIDLTKMPEHELLEILEELQMLHEYTDGQRAIKEELKRRQIGNTKVINSDREFFKELADDAKEREDKDNQEVEKLVENEDVVSEYNSEIQRLTRKAEQLRRMGQGKSAMEVEKQIEKLGKELREYTGNAKCGNAKDKNDKDLKIGDIVDVRGKKGKITKIIGDVIEVFYNNSGTYNPDRTDRHYADEATKVGNAGVSVLVTKIDELTKQGLPYDKVIKELLKFGFRDEEIKSQEKYIREHIGNSASDDKFAYVMREFDEGKLKTPDGKVVTDPAQAKAIAYSESKKAENGLARARNAIKK